MPTSVAPPLYEEVVSFIPKAIFLEDFLFGTSDEPVRPSLRELVSARPGAVGPGCAMKIPSTAKVHEQIRSHLDGMLVGPAMVALARGGMCWPNWSRGRGLRLHRRKPGQPRLHLRSPRHAGLDRARAQPGAADRLRTVRGANRDLLWSHRFLSSRPSTSYSTLLFGNPRIPRLDDNGVELLVNRGMNVWGSGGAHKTYFKKVDEIIVEIFNRPLNQQPQGICDMGCGDGSFLEHLYFVVKNRTARGEVLDRHPLILVGADFNKVARRVAKQTLRKAGIPTFHVIGGDINRPAQLASDLEELGLDIHDLLHVRSFLDHNRPYVPLANYARRSREGRSTGAFAHFGEEILADELEENLVRHLRRWAPYVGRFGLLVLELHTLPPALTAANLEKTPAVAYDGTHGFSDQYLVELPIFLDCAREAGLHADSRFQHKFPPSELATVSVNFFTTTSPLP